MNPTYSNPSPPRPIGEQRWRRHHDRRFPQGPPSRSTTSGCSRRRRRAVARRRWVTELAERWAAR